MSNKITSYQTAEYGKFEEIVGNSEYPPISVTRWSYPDTTSAFPSNSALNPLSSVDVYYKYAVLAKLINPEDIKLTLSGGDINLNLENIELNTDEIESLIFTSNTKLDVLTGIDYSTSLNQNKTNTLLDSITAANINVPGFKIPPYDEIDLIYVGSTNNLQTATYKENSTTVMSLSFVYLLDPPSSDNALLKNVKKI